MIKLYNTLTRKKEVFKSRKRDTVEMFVCGPTVYDASHIGHARTYLVFDMIVKYLKEKGYKVFYLQNITNIDDKIISRAKETNTTPSKLASHFEKDYLKDMKALRINSVTKYARATDYLKEIISQVKRLLKAGFAYRIKNGVYYDISKFKDYGKLSGRTWLQAEDAVSRVDEAKEKKNKGDFCLWKFSEADEPSWPSPWQKGRPGWHIEDTAITEKFFGPRYDIHGGARDLIFPHHEAEIAQMEAASRKKPMVKYWLHTGFLTVNGQKMSKSLGNFITIRDFINNRSPRILRFLILKNRYRSPIDYSESSVLQTEKELARIDEFVEKLKNLNQKRTSRRLEISKFQKDFEKAMEDDFNTPKAVAAIFELINRGNSFINQNLLSKTDAKNILGWLKRIDKFFNCIFWPATEEKIPEAVSRLAGQREEYREQRDWQKADEIRKEIKKLGWLVEDTSDGPKIKSV